MGGKEFLGCLEKRDLLNRPAVPVATLLQWGRTYRDAGLLSDAADFFEKAGAVAELSEMLETVSSEGDSFLFSRLCRVLKHEASSEEWTRVGKEAENRGKALYAQEAFRRAGGA